MNVRELLERLEGDQDFLRELLQMFRADSQTTLMKAREALAQEDLTEVSRAAHTLKGMLKNLSMNAAAENSSRFGNGRAEWRTGRGRSAF